MLNNITVHTELLQTGEYFLTAYDEAGNFLQPKSYSKRLFAWDEASFYGSFLNILEINDVEGIKLDAFGLLSLFAQDRFLSFIDWHWDELSFLCLTAAPALQEAMEDGIPVPNFTKLDEQAIGWTLPNSVVDEFDEEFWQQKHPFSEEIITTYDFIEKWYNSAIYESLHQNPLTKEKWNVAIQSLQQAQLSTQELQEYFTEERWKKWIGIEDNELPFSTGLRLIEPLDGEGLWSLEVIARSTKKEDLIKVYGKHKLPKAWAAFEHHIEEDITSWLKLVPNLEEKGQFKKELTEEEAWIFLTEASEKLLFIGATILLPSWWTELKQSSLKLKAKVKSTSSHGPSFVGLQSLMDFDWRISMNGTELTEDEFQKMVSDKRRLIYVNGQWVKLDPELIRQIQHMMKTAEKKGIPLSELFYQELTNDEMDDIQDDSNEFLKIQFELNQELKKMFSSLREVKQIPIIQPPSTLQGELRPYQIQGVSWLLFLRKYGFGACLADDMGLGKTVQVISYILSMQNDSHIIEKPQATKATLIVCPTSVLGNWQKELERFAPSLKVALYYGAQRPKGESFEAFASEYDVILTSYGMTHIDQEEMSSLYWNSIIIDEAQNIKNASTKQSRSVRKLKGVHQIALTGTPMENRLSELWAIFDFINKGYLGSLKAFQDQFVTSIERDGQQDKIKELQNYIQPFLLRRTKKDKDVALNLPDKIEQKEFVPLTSEQASLYEQLINDTFKQLEKLNGFERKGLILQMIGRLKQLCNHPALYLKEEDSHHARIRSSKLEKLFELVDAVIEQKESCLIFTQYIGMGEMIQDLLQKTYGHKVPFLNGSLGKKQRDTMIESFQNGEFPIFILSLKAGGTGLNLTAANHVIHYDRWWNPAVENQATDRAYRIGQNRFVHVHKLICTGTLEEKIDKMLDQKQALNDEIITGENWITEMSTEEIKELVSLQG
ncbi:DEAD/DEAH box helicase [Bacillus massiliigorillae]|uniref:DEAD/DEAH box helicase n=1 Tax=Bacillus massiliigorillae TaxID=1243664 RepID=UPI0003A0FCD0|nr:DEAD/DEAH box helicase [Bacillus massiliigorillae]